MPMNKLRSYHFSMNSLMLILVLWTGQSAAGEEDKYMAVNGAALTADKCLNCHARPGPWPDVNRLSKLTSEEVYRVITAGLMRELAIGLNDAERQAIAAYIGNLNPEKASPASGGLCQAGSAEIRKSRKDAGSLPGRSPGSWNDRYVRDVNLTRSQVAGMKLKWSFVFPDTGPFTSAGSEPTVVDGRLYIGNLNGMVYALDAKTGCTYWSFKARTHVRSNIAVWGDALVFADYETNVYALAAETGALRWLHRADEQPSARMNGALTLHDGVVYVPVSSNQEFTVAWQQDTPCCSFRGMVVAIDAATGKRKWKTSLIDEPLQELGVNANGVKRYGPSGLAVYSTPTVDRKRQLLYIPTGNQLTEPRVAGADAVIALDLDDGKKRWVKAFVPETFQHGDIWNAGCEAELMFNETESLCPPMNAEREGDRDISAPVVLKTLAGGKDVLLVGTKDGVLFSIDPDNEGAILWQSRIGRQLPGQGPVFGGIEHGIAVDDHYAYVPIADMVLLQGISDGSMARVDIASGKILWQKKAAGDTCKDKPFGCNSSYMAAPTLVGQVLFAGSNDGILRAFDTNNGNVIWSFDTTRRFKGVNGLTGSGGSMGRYGPTIANGMLYQSSGYGHLGVAMPGNVLLAFEIPEVEP